MHKELRQFYKKKRAQPSTSTVYLLKWLVSILSEYTQSILLLLTQIIKQTHKWEKKALITRMFITFS